MVSLLNSDGRKAAAFAAILGGAMVMTVYAAVTLYYVRDVAHFVFWLGETALGLIAICLTGFMSMFVKRSIKAGKDGIEITDQAGNG